MNKQIDEILKVALKDNARVMDLAHDLYEAGRESVPKGLPGVTSNQVNNFLMTLEHDVYMDTLATAYLLKEWFNDPDRDAPVKATMSREAALETLRTFFCFEPQKYRDAIITDMTAKADVLSQALHTLARDVRDTQTPPHVGMRKDVGGRFEAERDAHLVEDLDLNSLPDYETWFETHGWETVNRDTRMAVIDSDVPATVHELYTMFRARLLDELHQTGVIGGDHD